MRKYNFQQRFQRYFCHESVLYRRFEATIWLPLMKSPGRSSGIFLFIIFLLVGAFLSTRFFDGNGVGGNLASKPKLSSSHSYPQKNLDITIKPFKQIEIPLDCAPYNRTRTCSSNYPTTTFDLEENPNPSSAPTCPEYFRWIHEDLRPWALTGITRDMVERAKETANFRLVILKGRVYVEKYHKAFQTRDVFTLWGILQLLRRYPGKVPDLELMFDCVDWPVIKTMDYQGPNSTGPPPLFRYCGDDSTLDIVFPDWSFWGWPEINIKPWENLLKDLKEGNGRKRWMDREPYAYWKGNPAVAVTRQELIKCNVSATQDWNARVYAQDWSRESQQGYKQSDLGSQCMHRYKIYIEGSAWSVSEKYILACDSVTLLVKPHYYDFFTRGLMPVHHYWPVRDDDKCKSIKFAVDWGNSHKQKAQGIGKAASEFIQEDLKMEYVYDYMFHLLNEYAKLLTFKPIRPRNAVELCAETMACPAQGLQKKFFMESMVKGPTYSSPCTMPPPYDPPSLHAFLKRKENSIKRVELWEKNFWENKTKQT
ncbi:O-glucosyltransferase rumi homolog [Juglans microcarpa x Juglans regia]|uniref:O-glucosyltransferase rumi homolog n=1 Tax=Juglans microcarpa x Juglans regia TaxID=2249226 RepID=UPI001B7F598E|nr:O-glucosyltransferase rumi homolog [Juglans microcarpa x Juglans regia]